MESVGRLGIIAAALFGGGYVITGESDFEVPVNRPADEVYSAFSGARTFNGGLRNAGYAKVKVRTERPSDKEIVFWSGEEGAKNAMRIALTIEPGSSAKQSTLTAAIDVPAVEYDVDGEDMVLSESKVEDVFEENIAAIAGRLSNGQDPQAELDEFRDMLDLVALATNPKEMQKFEDSLE